MLSNSHQESFQKNDYMSLFLFFPLARSDKQIVQLLIFVQYKPRGASPRRHLCTFCILIPYYFIPYIMPLCRFAIPPFHHSTILPFRHSAIPPFRHPAIPPFRHSAIPPFRHSAIRHFAILPFHSNTQ
jgi:hypothetical protein